MAVLDEWRSQRRERQQAVRSRQLEVRSKIAFLQEDRLIQGLHHRNLREQSYVNLQQQTQQFLADVSSNRHTQADLLAKQLDEFARSLSLHTNQFLKATAIDREKRAAKTTKELQDFHENLSATLAELRQQRQLCLQTIKTQTQELLTASYLQRIQTQAQLNHQLSAWMEALRSDIQSYLQELELMGEARKQELHQSFRESRAKRTAEAQLMRDRHAHFQAQLQKYRQNLQFEMWGNIRTGEIATKLLSAPETLSSSVAQKLDAGLVEPVAIAQPNMTALQEQLVYNYIHQGKGARLTEIETATALNRLQTVDALRSLLQKGLLVQRDRIYLTLDTVKTPVAVS